MEKVQKLPQISDAKTKEGIFSLQTKEVMNVGNSDEVQKGAEQIVWVAFRLVADNFLCRHKALYYRLLIKEMLGICRIMEYSMSLKTYCLHLHLDCFPTNLADITIEHGVRFHQDISIMEKFYQGQWSPIMLSDCC
jgi:hypothetical protein